MIKLIDKRIKLLEEQLKEATAAFEENDNSEDMHRVDKLAFSIEQFKSFKEEIRAKLAE